MDHMSTDMGTGTVPATAAVTGGSRRIGRTLAVRADGGLV